MCVSVAAWNCMTGQTREKSRTHIWAHSTHAILTAIRLRNAVRVPSPIRQLDKLGTYLEHQSHALDAMMAQSATRHAMHQSALPASNDCAKPQSASPHRIADAATAPSLPPTEEASGHADEQVAGTDAPTPPELVSLSSSPATSVPTSPDFTGQLESSALDLSAALSMPAASAQLLQLPDTWSTRYLATSGRDDVQIAIEPSAYKPALPRASAVVPLPQPVEPVAKGKTWSIAKGRFILTDEDDEDEGNDRTGAATWQDAPSLSAFWISDALPTPEDTDVDVERLWEEPQSLLANADDVSPSAEHESGQPATTPTDAPFEFEVVPGRGDHFIEVPLRVQLGRHLIRRKMTY
ncbi:hypothetical protein SYNPS1DRAFT_28512 [Syncephalis pseudoplumigaleata]|uniref:Uncharacterized protein n=1 Tax=Syncephalis pseudoplumigaleata TaxID=1712513 RepID=A0A4P9Z004_9FUNG|nr:hypothetical protein SYNPS1DRAFT_28512 [Syncephalis pseudoplumigaleata]|eukprot:RKP25767.1 hypothetical protein SYNPS1DRAFT_28512 [Syncephalis pseudoplumigaleata]